MKYYSPAKGERKTLNQEVEYYRSFKSVETRSFERVSRSSFFKGISNDEWEVFGSDAVTTSDAKLASMRSLLGSWRGAPGEEFSKVIYVGDSCTDIECLTEDGTTGIVIAEERNNRLVETLNRVGVDVKHVGATEMDKSLQSTGLEISERSLRIIFSYQDKLPHDPEIYCVGSVD